MTERQAQILRAIVEFYVKTAAPVGSLTLADHFHVSSATIRADMAELERDGYITHPHTSAGRIPTDKGYRHYVDHLHAELDEQYATANRLHRALQHRIAAAGEPDQAIRSAVNSLAETTHNVAMATLAGNVYMSGLSQLFAQPEFESGRRIHEVAHLLDSLEPWLRETAPTGRVNVYIGRENPIGKSSGCSLVISRFKSTYSDYSYIGIVGPTRQSYKDVMDLVAYIGNQLEDQLHG